MNLFFLLPGVVFLSVLLAEWRSATVKQSLKYNKHDWALNLLGLFVQGVLVPLVGMWLSYQFFPHVLPFSPGSWHLGWWGGFFFNLIVIDFLYYWEHRAFHSFEYLWRLHLCHHSSPRVDIWATSRNNLWINFLFVYLLINPIIAYACDIPEGFFAGAMLTASLDILRHTQLDFTKLEKYKLYQLLTQIWVSPKMHRSHHNMAIHAHNFGANWIIWDKLFGTYCDGKENDLHYQPKQLETMGKQFLYPLCIKDKYASAPISDTK